MKKWAFVSVMTIVVLFAVTTNTYSEKVRGVTNDTIKVGIILDQTGPAANAVIPLTKGIRSLFRYINEQDGIQGRKLKALFEDDRYSIPMAVSAFKKLIFRDEVVSLIGPTSTSGAVALSRNIDKQKIPTFPASSAEKMVSPFKRYIFTIQDIYPGQMKVIVDYILKDLKAKNPRIAFAFPDNEAGRADLEPGLERLKHYNLEPASKEVINPGAIEATSQVMNLKRAKADYIILCGSLPQPTIVLLRELKKFGLNVPLFGTWATCNEDVIRICGDSSQLFYGISAMSSWYDKGPGVAKMREVTLKYEPGSEEPYRGKTYTYGWVLATVMIEGFKRAGKNLSGETLVETLEGMQNFDTGGLTGPISYSPKSHKGGSTWKIFKAEPSTGKFIPMTEWRKPL
ncbi:MAG: ABC transporter substrate-binding protein [Thermodesulfobacteriota bacterium]|nr:ABC transporter substrate-binding protein [Thermodesulfobacteriota bacterium]